MNDRKRLIELINQAQAKCDDNYGITYSEQMADYLLENGVIVIDEKTALAMSAGARAIESDDFLMMSDYGKIAADKTVNAIPYRKAAKKLREIAEKALKEREKE